MRTLTNLLAATAALTALAHAANIMVDPALNAQLTGSSTQLQRLALLPDDASWKFDFTKQEYYTFSPGGVVNANAATFPATVGNDMTMATLNLGPCSMLPPHCMSISYPFYLNELQLNDNWNQTTHERPTMSSRS